MSNVIKAYTIRYDDQQKHLVDMNAKADEKVRQYMEQLQTKGGNQSLDSDSNEDGFVQGLLAAAVEPSDEETVSEEERMSMLEEKQRLQTQSIEQVNDQAQKIISEAKQQVTDMLERAKKDAQNLAVQIQEQARKDGYAKGQQQAAQELENEKKKLEEQKHQLNQEYDEKVKEFEPKFAKLLIAYVKRFTGVLMDEKQDIIMYLIDQELRNIDSSNTYLIHVSKDDFEIVNSQKSEIVWRVNENAQIEIIEDHMLTRGQCLIETDSRIIDCSLDVQLKNLISDIRLMAGKRGE